ncbi:amino acid ABC transporter permease [Thalassococcus sp. S3]|uniref:amino acid ABC transporter permease n=1 Tax=Thalassococcus sp. S3 TaxID=2017482 RepID=UPI00102473DA|nr:amino acid ABC transporter permease [Thalassococcus sp. S3]QBF30144.1 amino acid ABC transporter permease [Thalassococcus sp. S3]
MSDTHAQTVSFVRETQLPPAPPPTAQTGVVKWMRENLFNGIWGTLLTLISLYAIYSILAGVMPWLLNGVWNTSNIRECREVLEGATGGCFSVLSERWNQLLFGIAYPRAEYWRPTLAFILLFVAAAPVLFPNLLPRKLLIFTGLYPFVAFWLIWGGTILSPIVALAGFVVGYIVFQRFVAQSFAAGFFGAIAAAVVTWWLGGIIAGLLAPDQPWLSRVASRDMGGFMLNMILGTVCVSLSLPIGIVLALGRQSKMPIIKWICVIFIEFIRGVPLITLLFVANVVLAYFLPPGTNFDLILRVIIMITMFAAAYIAEVIRGGLAALPRGQYEAADSLGLDYAQAMRLIILPQALKISIPGIVNVAVGLFKDTTLVSIISMFDLVGMIRGPILASTDWNGVYWELWAFAALLFFVVCYGISQYSQWLERQLATDHR